LFRHGLSGAVFELRQGAAINTALACEQFRERPRFGALLINIFRGTAAIETVVTKIWADAGRTAAPVIVLDRRFATYFACSRADDLLDKGDVERTAMWRRVAKATEFLLSDSKPDGESLN